jgi:hypothetical protein
MRVQWNANEVDRMLGDPVLRDHAAATGRAVADLAAGMAPRLTGAGAGAIRVQQVELGPTGWGADVGTDQLHAYMRFPDRGTRYIQAQRFLERSADQVTRKG